MGRILVTGGAGMIGANLVKRLVAQGWEVLVVDNLWRGRLEYLHDTAGRPLIDLARNFHNRDLAVAGSCDDLLDGVDYVYHLADVVAGIEYVFGNQGEVFRQNLLINSNVISAVRRQPRIKGFIYTGTACSFPAALQSGVEARPLREEDQYPAAPESAYGWSKLMGEYEARLMEIEARIPVSILVLHNVYGAPCDFGEDKSQVIPALIRKAIQAPATPFVVFGSGRQGRAFVHVDDVVEALLLTLERGLGQGVVQIGPEVCTSIRELVELIVKISGKDIAVRYDASRPEGDKGRRADYTKARRVLGWEPAVGLEEGLGRLYQWIAAEMARGSAPASGPVSA